MRDYSDTGGERDPKSRRGVDAHRATVIAAEMRRLERHLLAIGPMPRAKLAESVGAARWREGTFDEAIAAGIRAGALRELAFGWLEATWGHEERERA